MRSKYAFLVVRAPSELEIMICAKIPYYDFISLMCSGTAVVTPKKGPKNSLVGKCSNRPRPFFGSDNCGKIVISIF